MSQEKVEPPCPKSVGEVYLHVSNSGVTFEVLDDPKHGPVVKVTTSTFGNLPTVTQVFTTEAGLAGLARLFEIATKRSYSKPYCFPAYTSATFTEGTDKDGLPILVVTHPEPQESSGGDDQDFQKSVT